MKKTKLLDRHGESIYKNVYDLDPSFWSDSIGTLGGLTKQVDKQPYANHVWVYGCIQAIADPVSNLIHELYDINKPDETIEENEILSILRKPNPFMDEVTLWEATISYLMLPTTRTKGGQCFWVGESGKKNQFTNWAKGEMPFEIYVFSDETIIADVDPLSGWIKGWKFIVAGKQIAYFTHEQVLRFYFYNPYSASQGLSPYSAIQSYVLQDSAADLYNTNMFNNNGRVAGYLQSESTEITEEQAKIIIEKWNQLYKGSGNSEKIALLPFGFKYEQFMKSYQDVQFKEQKVMNKEAVLAAYRVPESELSIYKTGMNKATSTQADRNFWQKRLLSLDKRIWRVINEGWIKNVAPNTLRGYSNLSTVEALQDDLNAKAESAFKYFQMNVPASEALKAVDAPVEWNKYKWLDRSFISSSLADAETMIGREPSIGFGFTPTSESLKKSINNKVNNNSNNNINKVINNNSNDIRIIQKDISIVDTILWNDFIEKVMEATERNFKKDFSERFLIKLRNEMLDKVDIWAKSNKAMDIFSTITKDNLIDINQFVTNYGYFLKSDFNNSYNDYIEGGASDNPSIFVSTGSLIIKADNKLNSVSANEFLFDMKDANDNLIKIYKPFVKEQRQKQKQKLKEELTSPIDWTVSIAEVDKYMKKRVKYLKEINSTTFRVAGNKIGSAIETALEEKQTVIEMAESIKDAIKSTIDIRQGHARTIARTEMGSIAQDTRWQVFNEINVKQHKWITAMDEKVRPAHVKLNGMVEDIGDEFDDSGLMYPLDPAGSPEEVINCRCITIPIEED
jgi:HK97 family phage portal protein